MVESGQLIAHELTGDLAAEVVKARSAEHFHQEHAQPVADLRQRQGWCHLLTPVGFPVELSVDCRITFRFQTHKISRFLTLWDIKTGMFRHISFPCIP